MAQQIGQHIEDLGLQVDDLAAASQLDALDVQLAVTESNPHRRNGASRTAQCSNRAVRVSWASGGVYLDGDGKSAR